MRILSWNLERPKQKANSGKNSFILKEIKSLNPEIIFLTETNSIINFDGYYKLESNLLPEFYEHQKYENGENRITIFSKFPFIHQIETYDSYTAICTEICTNFGNLVLYGSIIGSFGGRGKIFDNDLSQQKNEVSTIEKDVCFSGDFNISFSGFPYPSKKVINETKIFFEKNKLINLTENFENCAIHIIISKNFIKNLNFKSYKINIDRKYSDHDLVYVDINNL